MATSNIRDVFRAIAADPAHLQDLRSNPEGLAEKLNLTADQAAALRAADIYIVAVTPGEALRQRTTYTFETGSTITGRRPIRRDLGEERQR